MSPNTTTNGTSGTGTPGGVAPPAGGGHGGGIPGLEVARQQLNRVAEMLQGLQLPEQAADILGGIGTALQNIGGPAAVADPRAVELLHDVVGGVI